MVTEAEIHEQIEKFIYDYPILEFYHLKHDDLIYSDKVRYICEQECTRFGHSWACPPHIGPIDECMKKLDAYDNVFLFSTVAQVPDCLDFAGCIQAKRDHEQISWEIQNRFSEIFGQVLTLSTGCMICDECTYPGEPCRNPDRRLSTIESHGILIMETAASLGACYDCGNNMVVYFSLIFYYVGNNGFFLPGVMTE